MAEQELKKSLNLWDLLFFGVGTMLGAGIYAIIGAASGLAGNMLWLSFVVAAGVAFLTSLSYAEFVSRFPDAGGSFEYVKQSFGDRFAYVVGVLMFFTGVIAAAAIAISFASYLSRLVDLPDWISVVAIIGLMGLVNVVGVQSSAKFNLLATGITVLGLIFVVVVSLPDWDLSKILEAPPEGLLGVCAAGALIFFSFVGFEDLVKMAEEAKEPERDLPKAVIYSAIIVLIVYILVAISATNVLDWKKLSESDGPLSAVIESKAGRVGSIILTVVALFATSKTILSNILGTSRLLFDISRDSKVSWLEKLTGIVEKFGTPVFAVIVVTAVAMAFGMIGNLEVVASISNIFIITVFGIVNLAMIVWRLRNQDAEEARFMIRGTIGAVPIIPVIGFLATLGMLGLNIYNIVSGQG